jgi:FkbM family methyltransferase
MQLRCGDWAHIPIAFMGVYEPALTRLVVAQARPGQPGLLVDVGANFGYFSLLWAGLNPKNRALAFEPALAAGAALAGNIARNGFGDRVQLAPQAVGGERRRVILEENLQQTGWSHVVADTGAGRAVDMVRLDDELADVGGEIAFLKIDAEGHDWEVLEGGRQLFAEGRIRAAVFECDAAEYNGPRGNAWRHFAGEHGYRMNAFESGENSSGLMQCIIERIAPR